MTSALLQSASKALTYTHTHTDIHIQCEAGKLRCRNRSAKMVWQPKKIHYCWPRYPHSRHLHASACKYMYSKDLLEVLMQAFRHWMNKHPNYRSHIYYIFLLYNNTVEHPPPTLQFNANHSLMVCCCCL